MSKLLSYQFTYNGRVYFGNNIKISDGIDEQELKFAAVFSHFAGVGKNELNKIIKNITFDHFIIE